MITAPFQMPYSLYQCRRWFFGYLGTKTLYLEAVQSLSFQCLFQNTLLLLSGSQSHMNLLWTLIRNFPLYCLHIYNIGIIQLDTLAIIRWDVLTIETLHCVPSVHILNHWLKHLDPVSQTTFLYVSYSANFQPTYSFIIEQPKL